MKRHAALACFVLALYPAVGLCYGPDGHRIVCEIAWQNLDSTAKSAVVALIRSDSDNDMFNESCLWADEIKSDGRWNWARSLHYVNIQKNEESYNEERDCQCKDNCPDGKPCPPKDCVVAAIKYYRDVLADQHATQSEKLIALKFLGHFVGDLHQPLHAGFAYDRGGNDKRLEFFGGKTNLHRVWDSGLIRKLRGSKRWFEYAQKLDDSIDHLERLAWRGQLDPKKWANESHALAAKCYENIPRDGVIGEDYLQTNAQTTNQQLKKAGIRLAAILNEVLGKD